MYAPRRGSRAWTTLCATWQQQINNHHGWTCRRCGHHIPAHDRTAWQLGHPHNTTHGPTHITDLAPEHTHCNTSAGATTGNQARTGTLEPEWSL